MASDVAAEGELKPYLERLVHARLSYRLELTYGDLARLAGDRDLWVTAATSFSLQTGDAIRLYNGRFSLPADQLADVLSAAGKGDDDQANAQVALPSAALARRRSCRPEQRAAAIKRSPRGTEALASADARDLLGTLVSGRATVTRLPSDGQVS